MTIRRNTQIVVAVLALVIGKMFENVCFFLFLSFCLISLILLINIFAKLVPVVLGFASARRKFTTKLDKLYRSAAILRKRANVCPNNARQPNGNCQRNNISQCNGGNHGNNGNHGNAMQLGNGTHGLRLEGLRAGEPVSRNTAKSPALSNHDR